MRDVIEDLLQRIAVDERRLGSGTTVGYLRFFRAERLGAPEHAWEPGALVAQVRASSQALTAATIEWRADP